MITCIPHPRGKVVEKGGRFPLPERFGVDLGDFAPWCVQAFLQRSESIWDETAKRPYLHLDRRGDLAQEAYGLKISADGVTVKAASEQGVVWALTTLYKLLDRDRTLPAVRITDAPAYRHRGMSLDCARHFFPAQEVKKIIEGISLAKMNVLHWHLSDDQGWRLESRKFPKLHETSGQYFTQAEVRDVVEYARLRGVEIIPEIDLPGHVSAILAAYPQYSCFGRPVKMACHGGIYPIILCAGKEETYRFLEELLEEVCALFPGRRFHIGGDEAPKAEWKKCPHCQKKMREEGLDHMEDLQGAFSGRVSDILKNYGKTPICWNESLLARDVPKDAVVQFWTLRHANPMLRYINKGGRWIYSDMFELYIDYPYSMTPMKKMYGCRPHLGRQRVPDLSGLEGFEACLWTEHIRQPDHLERMIFPRIYALAELAWSKGPDYEAFCACIQKEIPRLEALGIACTPYDWCDPQGKARREEAIAYFAGMRADVPPELSEYTEESSGSDGEFILSFVTKFFRFGDLLALLRVMTGGGK